MKEAIGKLPQDASFTLVEETLRSHLDLDDQGSLYRPLLIACSSGRLEVVRFLLGHLRFSHIDSAPECDEHQRCHEINRSGARNVSNILEIVDENSGNTVFHFASTSPKYRVAMLDLLMERYNSDNERQSTIEAAKVNNHGDTPIMMAAAYNCTDALLWWVEEYNGHINANTTADSSNNKVSSKILTFQQRNNEGIMALAFAANHGHVESVKILLPYGLQDSDRCVIKRVLKRLEAAMKNATSQQQNALMKIKYNEIQACVNLIDAELNRIAAVTYEDLMEEEEVLHRSLATKKKPRKKKKKNINSIQTSNRNDAVSSSHTITVENELTENNSVIITQLQNGMRAVSVPGTTMVEEDHEDIVKRNEVLKPSVEELFQKRVETRGVQLIADHTQEATPMEQPCIDTISATDKLNALCLDVSQLLLPSHGMAMLSASQLDSIDEVLRSQLNAVKTARDIQRRLHETANTSDNHR